MSISVVGETHGNTGTGTLLSFDLSFHASAAAGDIMIVAAHVSGNTVTATSIEHIDGEPDDWTAVADGITFPVDQSTNSRIVGAWWRRLTQADIDNGLAPTIALSGAVTGGWSSITLRGQQLDTAVIGVAASAVASATSVTLGALTGVTVGSALVAFVHGRVAAGTAALTGWTPDADYTEIADHGTNRTTATNPNVRMACAYRLGVAQGNYSGDSFAPNATASLGSIVIEVLAEPLPSTTLVLASQVTPLVELRTGAGGSWTASDVRYGGPGGRAVVIHQGRDNEQANLGHATCTVTFDNRTGNYSPRNPLSSNYGKLRQNTGLRVGRPVASDTATRTASNGFGTSDSGHPWTVLGAVSPYSVASGKLTITANAVSTVYAGMLGGISARQGLIRADIAPGEVATGASMLAALMVQWQNTGLYYYGALVFQTGGTVDIAIVKRVDGVNTQISPIVSSLAYDASSSFHVELGFEDGALQLTIWDNADLTQTATTYALDDEAAGAGMIGVRASLSASNSNGTVVFTFDNLRFDSMRFAGEVPSWEPVWDTTGNDATATVTAHGVTSRIGTGQKAIRSAVYRYLTDPDWDPDGRLVAAWPLEDGPLATAAQPAVGAGTFRAFSGTHPSGAVITNPEFGSGHLAPWLPPVLSWSRRDGIAIMYGPVSMPDFSDTEYNIEFLVNLSLDSAALIVDSNPSYIDGSSGWPQLTIDPVGREVKVSMNGEPESSTSVPELFDGNVHYIRWSVEQSGGFGAWGVEVDGTLTEFGTTGGPFTVDAPRHVALVVDPTGTEGGAVSVGYLSIWHGEPTYNPALSQQAGVGYAGETAYERGERLADEVDLLFVGRNSADDTELMGPQGLRPLLTAIEEIEGVDRGLLFEPANVFPAIGYRSRESMIGQAIALTLSYSNHELAAVPRLRDDLSLVVNDVTVTKIDGSARGYAVTAGPLSTAAPPDGVGTYDRPLQVNVYDETQCQRIAEWVAGNGTVDAARVPAVRLALHRSAFIATLINDTLNLSHGDRISISDMPTTFLPPGDVTGLMVGWTEEFDQFEHYITPNLIPDEVWSEIGVWGDSATDTESRWDTESSTVTSDFDAGTDTSLSVTTAADKSLWVTTATDATAFPFNIQAAGVVLEVTAIVGASSPQTFTVTAAPVNGIEKTIAAGESVSLADPVYWGW